MEIVGTGRATTAIVRLVGGDNFKMSAYYNEHDPKAAAWLRELIKRNLIAPGEVDERSITEVQPDDIRGFRQVHFFAGIGGWSLALRLAGVPDDARVWTGSCPCQPFSSSGRHKGTADERHLWPEMRRLIEGCNPAIVFGEQVASAEVLGSQKLKRLLRTDRESAERKAIELWFPRVRADLEARAYCVGGCDLPAACISAPHIRQRLYWVAYAMHEHMRGSARPGEAQSWRAQCEATGCGEASGMGYADGARSRSRRQASEADGHGSSAFADGGARGLADAVREGRSRQSLGLMGPGHKGNWSNFDILHCRDGKARRVESGTFPLAHGVPARVVRLRGYGNAIVPQVAAEFIKASLEAINDLA